MADLARGLHETILTEALHARIRELADGLHPDIADLRAADAADRIALHVAKLIQRALEGIRESQRVERGVQLARQLIEQLGEDWRSDAPLEPGRVLRAVLARLPDGTPEHLETPLIPVLDTALLTNSPGEPRVGSQLLTEIASADRIDILMAFIRRSGLRPFLDAIRRHIGVGRLLRVLTTTFTGTTESRALEELQKMGAHVRVSYETGTTRLHAKAWLFHRTSGFSTAYVGSSNLTHAAQVTGLEWNVRVAAARNPDVVGKVAALFESYWNGGDFIDFDAAEFARRSGESDIAPAAAFLSPLEVRLEPFQERLLEQIELSRVNGHHRNLLVAATGTGKTVMAAVDYARLRARAPRSRLLFVAHRREILDQALATFRHALRDPAFGERWVGGDRPTRFEHVFASIQSMHPAAVTGLDPRHFDCVVVDEFHHAAASSYRALLERLQPVELLGLTATPERSDGLPVLHWFGDRIAAELRLWDAIDQRRLSPFLYYGIHDGTDLTEVPWTRGRGYDVDGLTAVLTADDAIARQVLAALLDRVDDRNRMRVLGFCVSVEHARFMARVFNAAGVASRAVWSDSSEEERHGALTALAAGELRVLFSVDLFNEGVDVPAVDAVLFLRPTDSPTLFIQQLGRGLRLHPGKSACTVLDFVGTHRKEFRFDRRFRALLGGSRKALEEQVARGFPFLPAGCHMELDPVASREILRNLEEATPGHWNAKIAELRSLSAAGGVSLSRYLTETGLEPEDVYTGDRSWSELREAAGLPIAAAGPQESALRRACGRMLHVDDMERIAAYRSMLELPHPPSLESFDERRRRVARMLVVSLAQQVLKKEQTLRESLALLWRHPQVMAETGELLDVLSRRVDHVHERVDRHPDVPLQVHARYTRDEVLAAFAAGSTASVPEWREGVRWVAHERADLLAFTLDKTGGNFSPTTRYRDYAISRNEIHWESQSGTGADSPTGMRYRNHAAQGSSILLFARLRDSDRAFWFLGPATYVRHESERPIKLRNQ